MKNAVILHGKSADSNANWLPWLKGELELKGYRVFLPDLPNSDYPNVQIWDEFILKNWQFDEDSVIIGHSAGAVEIFGILQELAVGLVIKKAIFVGGFSKSLGAGWEDLNGLFGKPFNFENIKAHCKEFIIIHSDNDPYVPLEHGRDLAKEVKGTFVLMEGQKHFNIGTMGEKYKKFPELLEYFD